MAKHYGNLIVSDKVTTQGLIVNSGTNSIIITDINSGSSIDFAQFGSPLQDAAYFTTDNGNYTTSYMGVSNNPLTNRGTVEILTHSWNILGIDKNANNSRNDFGIYFNDGEYGGNLNGSNALVYIHNNSTAGTTISRSSTTPTLPVVLSSSNFTINELITNSVMLGMNGGTIDKSNTAFANELRFNSSLNTNALISDSSSNVQMGIDNTDNTFWLGTDNDIFTDTKGFLWVGDRFAELGHKWEIDGGANISMHGSTSGDLQRSGWYMYQGSSNAEEINIIYSVDNRLSSRTMSNIGAQSYPVFLGGSANSTLQGVYNSVYLGGTNGTIDKSNTAFVNNLEVQEGIGQYTIDPTTNGSWGDRSIPDKAYVDTEVALKTPGIYTQIVTSEVVTATVTETNILGTAGVGGLTVPGNTFVVGDSYHCKIGGVFSSANGETLQMRIKSDGILLSDTGVVTLPVVTDKYWENEIDFVIRSSGTAGQASIITNGQFVYLQDTQNDYKARGFNTINNTTFDTTISNTLEITVEWGSTNAANSIHSEIMVLQKTF